MGGHGGGRRPPDVDRICRLLAAVGTGILTPEQQNLMSAKLRGLVSRREAARLLGVSPPTISYHAAAGRWAQYSDGLTLWYRRAELLEKGLPPRRERKVAPPVPPKVVVETGL